MQLLELIVVSLGGLALLAALALADRVRRRRGGAAWGPAIDSFGKRSMAWPRLSLASLAASLRRGARFPDRWPGLSHERSKALLGFAFLALAIALLGQDLPPGGVQGIIAPPGAAPTGAGAPSTGTDPGNVAGTPEPGFPSSSGTPSSSPFDPAAPTAPPGGPAGTPPLTGPTPGVGQPAATPQPTALPPGVTPAPTGQPPVLPTTAPPTPRPAATSEPIADPTAPSTSSPTEPPTPRPTQAPTAPPTPPPPPPPTPSPTPLICVPVIEICL